MNERLNFHSLLITILWEEFIIYINITLKTKSCNIILLAFENLLQNQSLTPELQQLFDMLQEFSKKNYKIVTELAYDRQLW